MDNKKHKTMSDSIKGFVSDTLQSLGQNPVLKGAVPAAAGAGLTMLQEIEILIRISGAAVGLIIGCLTLYVQIKKLLKK